MRDASRADEPESWSGTAREQALGLRRAARTRRAVWDLPGHAAGRALSGWEAMLRGCVRRRPTSRSIAWRLHTPRSRSSFSPIRVRGNGQAGIRDRVARHDGQLVVESAPGEGTADAASFPLVGS